MDLSDLLSVYKQSKNERELQRSDLELRSLVPNMFDGAVERVGGGMGGGGGVMGEWLWWRKQHTSCFHFWR